MTTNDKYQESLASMYRLRRFGIKLGLDTIRRLLRALGDPHKAYRCVHVAGTNGKGSIASALTGILSASRYRTGLFTSPHLVRFNERIRVDGREITDPDVVLAYERIREIDPGEREPTFFEVSTAMALDHFARKGVDWAVIETGMGGRLDATNILVPELSVITNISLEHRAYLGDTLSQIAGEKAGIIKEEIPVVTGVRQTAAWEAIRQVALARKAPLYRYGKDFRVRRRRETGTFAYYGIDTCWRRMRTGLMGNHQVDNAALVLAACEVLRKRGAELSEEAIRKGLEENRWPGRLEVVRREPLVILDGAHNLMAARNLGRFMAENLSGRRVTLVVGILDDKPFPAILRDLCQGCERVVVTRPKIDRALEPQVLFPEARKHVADVAVAPTVAEAVKTAIAKAAPEEAIVVAGSLYVVGEAKEYFESAEG